MFLGNHNFLVYAQFQLFSKAYAYVHPTIPMYM